MTNENDWWNEEPYMTRGPYSDYFHFEKIVAEATRLGEMKAWEEAQGMLSAQMQHSLFARMIEAKLTELKK